MLDHISLGIADLERSRAFYDKALAPLGYRRFYEFEGASGYGTGPDKISFWIGYPLAEGRRPVACAGSHVALAAESRAAVDAFYEAAIAAGGTDNGKPGLRPQYHESYYGAFVMDPDGHAIEAVCHRPE